jgi:predicted SAM-dependent methyltransferase
MRLQLKPLYGDPVEIGNGGGQRVWAASTIDPAFDARSAEGSGPFQPGWYRVSAPLRARSGEIRAPRLYFPDSGGGFSEGRTLELARQGGVFTADFYLAEPIDHLRFDPSNMPCEFTCEALEMIPISGPGASEGRPGLAATAMSAIRDRVGSLMKRAATATQLAPGPARPPGRKQRVLSGIKRDGVGIEIGPSHDPLAPKREGFNVHIIDHASREELRAKYAAHNVALDMIEEVDFVWRGESYLDLTKNPRHYDWIIGSHLIEHTPDLIAFLADCDSVLKDDGVLSLIIPDKRFVFDHFRPITGLARVIDAHLAGQKIHSEGAVAEYFMNVVGKNHGLAWDAATPGEYGFIHDAEQAKQGMADVRERHAYLDIHNWCFVPSSFRLIMADLHTLGYTQLREVQFHATEGAEFYITLGRHGQGPQLSRMELLKRVEEELAVPEPR